MRSVGRDAGSPVLATTTAPANVRPAVADSPESPFSGYVRAVVVPGNVFESTVNCHIKQLPSR